jgi:protoheme IX farnesyltransferase
MKRTERRPLPSGRLFPEEALFFGIALALAGLAELTLFINGLTGFLGALTFCTYIFLYTPLKRVTPFSTIVGAVPGALPPMIGWAAARNAISIESWALFGILFCWQIPHFLSLAWMYKKDYARAGFRMLTVDDDNGKKTSRQILIFAVILIPATLVSSYLGLTGLAYTVAALMLGGIFLSIGILFLRSAHLASETQQHHVNIYARRMFFASLLYLPLLMFVMSMDKI